MKLDDYNNQLFVCALNQIYTDLPPANNDRIICINNNPGYEGSNLKILQNKGWQILEAD